MCPGPKGEQEQAHPRAVYFLRLATVLDLKSYVKRKLSALADLAKRSLEATALLNFLLVEHDNPDSSNQALSLPSAEMVSHLLANGANPNWMNPDWLGVDSSSAWENTILYTLHRAEIRLWSSSIPIPDPWQPDRVISHDSEIRARRYLQIMPLLVKAGADLQINVLSEEDLLSDFLFETANNANFEIAERVLMKVFPVEAAPLLFELQKALALQNIHNPKRSRKRLRGQAQDDERNEEGALEKKNFTLSLLADRG
jgi:hypothetical protein